MKIKKLVASLQNRIHRCKMESGNITASMYNFTQHLCIHLDQTGLYPTHKPLHVSYLSDNTHMT